MGIVKLFVEAAGKLETSPSLANGEMLEGLFGNDALFAYVGGRAKLEDLVLNLAGRIQERILRLRDDEAEQLRGANPALGERLRKFRSKLKGPLDSDKVIRDLFGPQWKKDSGKYPDFILGLEQQGALGDGAILELKDSKGQAIASFNSTIPTRYKSLEEVDQISKSTIAIDFATLFDLPQSLEQSYRRRERPCFYLVRTESRKPSVVRISFVDGSFFETLPKKELLGRLWMQVLSSARFSETQKEELIEPLSNLEQGDIAKSRSIENASIKPRLRLMAEVHTEGNPHRYSEIPPRTLNLIVKQPNHFDQTWVQGIFETQGYETQIEHGDGHLSVKVRTYDRPLQFRAVTLLHKRNGAHCVIQYQIPTD